MAKRKKQRAGDRPQPGKIVSMQNAYASFINSLTPNRIKSIFSAALGGDGACLNDAIDWMLSHDAHVRRQFDTRLLAVRGLEWEILTAGQMGKADDDDAAADRVADYCREVIDGIDGFDTTLNHLLQGIGRGVALAEIEWETAGGHRPVALHEIPFASIYEDISNRIRIVHDNDRAGTFIDEQPRGKFIAHCPSPLAGSGIRGALLLPALLWVMLKYDATKFWAIATELFGQPWRTATYPKGENQSVVDAIVRSLQDMGASAGGAFPEGVNIEFHEAGSTKSGSTGPHERLITFAEKEITILIIGQTLTTEIGATGGAMAAAKVHNEVREDLRDDDLNQEAVTIRRDLLTPLVRLKFGDDAPVPYFRRVVEELVDIKAEGETIALAVNELGLQIPQGYAARRLGLQLVKGADEDAPIPGAPKSAAPAFGINSELRVNSLRGLLDSSRLKSIIPFFVAAVAASTLHAADVLAYIGKRSDDTPVALADAFAGMPIDDLVELNRQGLLASELAGRVTAADRIERRRVNSTRLVINAITFDRLPFVEAIEAFRDRLELDPDLFLQLDAEARSRAWRVAGVYNMQLLSTMHRTFSETLETGGSARDWRLSLPQVAEREGWTGENPWHAEIAYFQNFAMSHSAGNARQMTEAGIDHWQFLTGTNDACPICEPFVNQIFRMTDKKVWPPLHFGCNCYAEVVFEGEVDPNDVSDSSRIKSPGLENERSRDNGFKFDVDQYANLEPINLSKFPTDLQPAFSDFSRKQGWKIA